MAESDPHANTDVTARLEEQLTRTNERLTRLEAAIRDASLLSTLQHQPRNADVLDSLPTDVAVVSGPPDRAAKTHATALDDHARQAEAHFQRGVAHCQNGEFDQAISAWQQVLQLQPNNAYALANIGIVFTEQGRWQEARDMFAQVLRLQPDNAEAYYGLGMAEARTGNYAAAIVAWEQTLRLQPDHADARYNLAVVRQRLGRDAVSTDTASQTLGAPSPTSRIETERDTSLPSAELVRSPESGSQMVEAAGGMMRTNEPTTSEGGGAPSDAGALRLDTREIGEHYPVLRTDTMPARPLQWLRAGGLMTAGAALAALLFYSRLNAPDRSKEPTGQPFSAGKLAHPISAGSPSAAPLVAPIKPAAEPPEPGTMQIRLANGLSGTFSYWFVSKLNPAVHIKPLPRPNANGVIVLPIPAAFNQPGAQLRVLDDSRGKVARVPVMNLSRHAVVVQQQVGANLLRNADFTQGDLQWMMESTASGRGTLQIQDGLSAPPGVSGRVAHFDILTTSTQNWHVQCYQSGVDLKEGQVYLLSFWARADRNRELTLDAILDRPDWHTLGLVGRIAVTSQWNKYLLPFTASQTQRSHARLSIILGDTVGTVDIAGLALRRVRGADRSVPLDHNAAVTVAAGDFN